MQIICNNINFVDFVNTKPKVFLRMLWCSQIDDHPKNNLAKSSYILDIKVKTKHNPSIFLTTYSNSSYKLTIWIYFCSSNFCEFGPFFFDEKSFVYAKIIFFTLKFGEILSIKKKHYTQPLKVKRGPNDKITLQIGVCFSHDFEWFEDQLFYIKIKIQIPLWPIPRWFCWFL